MAEVVSLIAASVQFIDVGFRACIMISRLCSDVKNAPRKLQTTCENLKHLIDLVRTIQSDLSVFQNAQQSIVNQAISQSDLDAIVRLIQACAQQARSLEDTLKTIGFKADDSMLKRCLYQLGSLSDKKILPFDLQPVDCG
jgi:hypothetical protein